jgi:heme-degrading monooxygenase HmoA
MSNVRFINCFEVDAARHDDFYEMWKKVNVYMAAKPGYVGHRLHRSLAPDARFRFINYVEWESVRHWQDAHDEGFRALAIGPQWEGIRTIPTLCEVIDAGGTLAWDPDPPMAQDAATAAMA